MSAALLGIGTALPSHQVSQTEAADLALDVLRPSTHDARMLSVLYKKSGVQQRHASLHHRIWAPENRSPPRHESRGGNGAPAAVPPDFGPTTKERMLHYSEHALPLAEQACRGALDEAGVSPRRVTHLVTVSCTGFESPGVDIGLVGALPLAPTTERTNIGFMGCHGAINGLRVARALAESQPGAVVLLCCVELCVLHYYFQWDVERMLGNALFGDGAAAAVIAHSESADRHPRIAATGSCVLPGTAEMMTWQIGDNGFEMFISNKVPEAIHASLRPWMVEWLARSGRALESVASWVIHPGGPRILSATEETLGLCGGATAISRAVLAECGNMSSPTVLFILDRHLRGASPLPCLLLAFGPGLVAEAALVE